MSKTKNNARINKITQNKRLNYKKKLTISFSNYHKKFQSQTEDYNILKDISI